MKRLQYVTSLLLVMLAISLLGTFTIAAQDDVITITWWTEDEDFLPMVQENFVAAFNAAHDNIRLELVGQQDLDVVLRTAIQAGAAPDILQTPGAAFIAEFVSAGVVLPMDEYAEEYNWREKLLPWAYESGILDGVLYSIPLTYESMILLYNSTLFEEHGWVPPTTLAELEALAADMEAAGIKPFSYGNAGWKPSNEHLMGIYLNNYAGPDNVYRALIGELSWTDPLFAEASELLRTHIVDNGWFGGSLELYYTYDWPDFFTEVSLGEAGMIMIGTWGFRGAFDYFGESDHDWDWAPLPIFSENLSDYSYDLATGSTLSINTQSPHPEAAAEVLNFLLSDPTRILENASYSGYGEWVVPVDFDEEDFPEGTDARIVRFFTDFADRTAEGRYGYTTWTFWPARANVQLWEDIELVWAGEMTIETYLEIHQQLWEEARADGVTPPVPSR
jgi:raffinose/stachyose/melibiose transport system substrate-binding protein